MHLGLYAAAEVIPSPSPPDGPSDALCFAEGFVSCNRTGGVGLAGFCVLARRGDCNGAAGSDGVMAYAGVKGAVDGDAADLLVGRDLVEQLGQHWYVADVNGGKIGGSDLQAALDRQEDFIEELLGR